MRSLSIQTEITRIENAKAELKTAINAKGGTLTNETIDDYAEAVNNLPSSDNFATKDEAQGYVNTHNQSSEAHSNLFATKLSAVSGAVVGNLPRFNSSGGIEDSGLSFTVVNGILNVTYEE